MVLGLSKLDFWLYGFGPRANPQELNRVKKMPKSWNLRDLAKRIACADAEPIRHSVTSPFSLVTNNTAQIYNPQYDISTANAGSSCIGFNSNAWKHKTHSSQEPMCANYTRPRSYARFQVPKILIKLCTDDRMNRIIFRKMALAGELPGVQKASW